MTTIRIRKAKPDTLAGLSAASRKQAEGSPLGSKAALEVLVHGELRAVVRINAVDAKGASGTVVWAAKGWQAHSSMLKDVATRAYALAHASGPLYSVAYGANA